MSQYVIKSWEASEQPIEGSRDYIRIRLRAAGLLSWLLALFKVDPTVILRVSEDKVTLEEGSLAGSVVHHTPMHNTCSTFYGYLKPWREALGIAVIIGSLTFFLMGIPGIILGILYYVLKKTLTIGYTDMGGLSYSISFSRSVIEGKNINEEEASRVCAIIQGLVDTRQENRR